MGNILDDEFVIQMDEAPPFSWILQSPNRFMNCESLSKFDKLTVHARGNALEIAKMVKDLDGSEKVKVSESFALSADSTDCIISYSGQLKDAIRAVETSTRPGIVMSSGGVIKNSARTNGWNYIPLPKGYPARFLFPEVFGCLLSLQGKRVDGSRFEKILEENAPSQLTADNEAKRVALELKDKQVLLVSDESSRSLANELAILFVSNSGIKVRVESNGVVPFTGKLHQGTSRISFSSIYREDGDIRVGGFPYCLSTLDGFVKNVLIGELASLYLGILNSHDIELLDRDIE